ncbi:MAG: phosphate-starvation-inducible PsiE family protein [Thermodesulfobacteriota bacterium]
MAIARKVIIFDFKELDPEYIWASGGVILALGITYWLLVKQR